MMFGESVASAERLNVYHVEWHPNHRHRMLMVLWQDLIPALEMITL